MLQKRKVEADQEYIPVKTRMPQERRKKYLYGGMISHYTSNCIIKIDQKVETTCVHCGNKFDSKITLGKHVTRSVLCKQPSESNENNETTELSNLDY